MLNTLVLLLKEHFNFYSSHFFDRALVLLLESGFLVLYTSLVACYFDAILCKTNM